MEGLLQIIKDLGAKLTSFFDVFDLSFFISGGACLTALIYLNFLMPMPHPVPDSAIVGVLLTVFATYVLGLVCFAAGRGLRRWLVARWDNLVWRIQGRSGPDPRVGPLKELMGQHDLARLPGFERYAELPPSTLLRTLYPRLWAELRQTERLKESFKLINSYWVRAAIYDGLLPALGLWATCFYVARRHGQPHLGDGGAFFWIEAALVLAVLFCAKEAARADRYQVEELVATLRWLHDQPAPAEKPLA